MEIKILNLENGIVWTETFTSQYLMNKRLNKLKYSKKLRVLSYFKY